jgi:hypothetical protein
VPIDQVRAEHAPEEHDFGSEEPPHAQGRGVTLLLFVGEVVSQFRTTFVFDRQWCLHGVTIAQVSPLAATAFSRTRRLPKLRSASHQN